jgi:protein-S-isoprenylcysteine O-methyltransferase Ste14
MEVIAAYSKRFGKPLYLSGRATITVLWLGYLFIVVAALRQIQLTGPSLREVVGYGVLLIGSLLRSWALFAIRGFYYSTTSIRRNHVVIMGGPYRRLRHPLYLGLSLELVGLCICIGSVIATVCVSVLCLEIQRHVRREAILLASYLGQSYRNFCTLTWDIGDVSAVHLVTTLWERLVSRSRQFLVPAVTGFLGGNRGICSPRHDLSFALPGAVRTSKAAHFKRSWLFRGRQT